MVTKTLYRKEGSGPLKRTVPVEVDINSIITSVKEHFSINGKGFIKALLDKGAQSKGYTDIVTACSYASAPNPFQAESQAFVSWQGDVWAAFFKFLDSIDETNYNKIDIGTTLATFPQLESYLPKPTATP